MAGVGEGVNGVTRNNGVRVSTDESDGRPASVVPDRIVDFHSHYTGSEWPAVAPSTSNESAREQWREITRKVSDLGGMLAEMDELGVSRRVLCAPPYLVAREGPISGSTVRGMNDHLAETVSAHPDRLSGLATIDAFGGRAAAAEARRAIVELGLSGIVIDCMSEGRLLDSPDARPTLEVAAEYGVPVLAHPVSLPPLSELLPGLGEYTETLARGTTAAASLIALIRTGTLDRVAGLKLVVPWLGGCGLVLAGTHDGTERLRAGTPDSERWNIYVDTMGFEPHAIRYATDLLGADHVLVGSDWPIAPQTASRERVGSAFAAARLDAEESELLGSGTAMALIGGENRRKDPSADLTDPGR
jgi:predicted TIM-barrel fold metal-dependent hydrolase